MSTASSDSDEHYNDDDSEYNYIPGEYTRFEAEIMQASDIDDSTIEVGPYAGEPIADETWIREYRKRQEDREQRLETLKDRREGKKSVDSWCSCGNCSIEFLQNDNECVCCKEFDSCVESLSHEWVLQDMQTAPACITLHPAFSTICMNRWSLKLAASKYRTIDKKTYRQSGSAETFMRNRAYREFIHLVYDHVGKKRIPVPACTYHAIRSKFKPAETSEHFTGFQDDSIDE